MISFWSAYVYQVYSWIRPIRSHSIRVQVLRHWLIVTTFLTKHTAVAERSFSLIHVRPLCTNCSWTMPREQRASKSRMLEVLIKDTNWRVNTRGGHECRKANPNRIALAGWYIHHCIPLAECLLYDWSLTHHVYTTRYKTIGCCAVQIYIAKSTRNYCCQTWLHGLHINQKLSLLGSSS